MANNDEKTGKTWLLCVDGSKDGKNAYHFCTLRMDKKKDSIVFFNCADQINQALYAHAYVTSAFIQDAQVKLNEQSKRLLREYGHLATRDGVKHSLLTSTSSRPGEMAVLAAKEKGVDAIVVGRRGMGAIKRFFLGSTSRYILEHAKTNVILVRGEYDPEEEHDATLSEIKRAEEVERQRRIREHDEELADEAKRATFQSALDRNLAIMAEEQERRRRLKELGVDAEEQKAEKEEEDKEREAALIGVVVEEEEERHRRESEFPEYAVEHFQGPQL